MGILRLSTVVTLGSTSVLLAFACGGSDSSISSSGGIADGGARGVAPAGQACTTASQCYASVDGGAIKGAVTCITKVTNGYCTHACTQDADCCAAPGECLTGVAEVCSPLENQGAQYCFLSCDPADIQRATAANGDAGFDAGAGADAYCQTFAGASTSCRSSGGGSKNRKLCLP